MTHSRRVYEGWGEDSEVTSTVEGNSHLSSHHCLWSVALVSSGNVLSLAITWDRCTVS